ncbi:MAG: site-2 protease family protein, partial [Candidatus Altarchaeaceae archaeon]
MHELSHSIIAIKFKFKVRGITLFPIGGVADVEIKENPKAEFFIALAGPLFNFLFAWMCFIILFLITPEISEYLNYHKIFGLEFNLSFEGILGLIIWINFLLGAFNTFFPAFPMDGGRILRSLLAMKFDYVLATKYALIISKIL